MGQTNPYPSMDDTTTIAVAEQTADKLHEMKDRGESYDDVINRLLESYGGDADE